MNKKQYIAPALALVIVATWFIYLRTSTASMNRDNIAREASMNRENIEQEKKLPGSPNASDASRANAHTKNTQTANSDAPVISKSLNDSINSTRDWKSLARVLFAEEEIKDKDVKYAVWFRIQKIFTEMSGDELMAAHLEIKGLPSNTRLRLFVENEILKNLELHHPEYAFSQHIANFANNERITEGLGRFHLWLARDPAAATAWYESEVAKGTFDKTLGDNYRLRHPFEAGFITSLLTTDPAAAVNRMKQIPPEQRKELILSYLKASESDPKVLADLIRKTVNTKEQAEVVILKAIDHYPLDEPAKVLESLSRINATQEERSTFLQMEAFQCTSLKRLEGDGMKKYRDWSLAIDPSSADRSTGLAFAESAEIHKNYDYITKLANNYHGLGAGDDFIIGFIEGSGTRRTPIPLDMAREFAMKIQDQTRRNEILQKLQ